METLQLLQKITETPRYNDNFSNLLSAQRVLMNNSESINSLCSGNGWNEGAFQADITIQVDID